MVEDSKALLEITFPPTSVKQLLMFAELLDTNHWHQVGAQHLWSKARSLKEILKIIIFAWKH